MSALTSGVRLLVAAALLLTLAAPGRAEVPAVLAVLPYLPAVELVERFRPLADYLSERLGRPVEVRVTADYTTLIDAVGRDEVDLAYIGPAPYVEMVRRYGRKHVLGRLAVNGSPTFRGIIVVRRDSGLKRLSDLAGKRFAFGAPESTMSHLLPRCMLLEAGIDLADLAAHAFLGSHNNVALGVLMGAFDAGAVKDEVYHAYMARGLTALAATPPISEQLFVATNRFDAAQASRLSRDLLDLNRQPDGMAVVAPITADVTGVAAAQDSDLDSLRAIMARFEETVR